MAEKQAALNGAYYGPSIPPPAQRYHRPGRGSGGCCCCLFSLVFKIILAIVVILGLAVLIFWLVVRPNEIKVHVTDASLSSFSFANNSNNLLNYNLSLTISIRNPNKKMGVYYDKLETSAYYEDQRIQTVWLPTFYQGHKNTTDLKTVMQGQSVVLLDADERSEFNMQSGNTGVYSIDVKLRMDIRFKVGSVRIGKFKPKVNCDLKLPLNTNGNSGSGFTPTRCGFDF